MFAFEQCLLCLGHHPNVWYEAALFLQESSRILAEKGVKTFSKENLYELY
jgi:cleavage stimulation factor subunit 3